MATFAHLSTMAAFGWFDQTDIFACSSSDPEAVVEYLNDLLVPDPVKLEFGHFPRAVIR
jgi:hypothetical protein